MANPEANIKRAMVKSVKDAGGYARRIEDQYGVGIFDLILIPFGLPVFMTEVKIVRSQNFGPSLRQHVELQRIQYVGQTSGHVIPLMIGYKEGTFYFSKLKPAIKLEECFSVTTSQMPFNAQLVQFYHSIRGDDGKTHD